MDENCTHDCSTCGSSCASREQPQSLLAPMNPNSNVKNVIAVVSGKGGVGKSLVTSLMACNMRRRGHKTAVLDADITGPSIPRIFGLEGARALGTEEGIQPQVSDSGVELMSVNLLLENTSAPVVWRGPVIAGVVKQFWSEVCWGDVDYMFVDMPPGTGDVPLTVFQSLPISGVVVVTTPQDLVSMIVEKAVNMARMMNVPVLGLVENMSWYECPCCGQKLPIFGESHVEEEAAKYGVTNTASLPINPTLAAACDRGLVEDADVSYLWEFAQNL